MGLSQLTFGCQYCVLKKQYILPQPNRNMNEIQFHILLYYYRFPNPLWHSAKSLASGRNAVGNCCALPCQVITDAKQTCMSNNWHQNIPCRKHLQYEPPIATCIKLYDALNCQLPCTVYKPSCPCNNGVRTTLCWKWLNMGGGNCRPDEFKYARINSGDYSFNAAEAGSISYPSTIWMFHVQNGKYFKRLGGVHTWPSSRNPFGLLRNAIFTNTPWTLAPMPTTDDGLLLSVHTTFRPTHTHVRGHNRAWPCTVHKSWRITLSIRIHISYQFAFIGRAAPCCYQPPCSCGNTVAVLLYWSQWCHHSQN